MAKMSTKSMLFAHKLRTFLAILGIAVGTASVVALLSSGQLATQQALKQFSRLGDDLMAVNALPKDVKVSRTVNLDPAVISKINQLPSVKSVAPYSVLYLATVFNGQPIQTSIIAADERLQTVLTLKQAKGFFINHVYGYQPFCVIGSDLAERLSAHTSKPLIGQQIQFGQQLFTISGILAPAAESAFFSENANQSAFISIPAAARLEKQVTLQNLVMRLDKNTPPDVVKQQLQKVIDNTESNIRLFFRSAEQILAAMQKQGRIFSALLGLIGAIALFIAGVGVMNIMLVSVTERKREIGLRLAIGATRYDIQRLFLKEAVCLALLGGLLGVIIGNGVVVIICHFFQWSFSWQVFPSLLGFLSSALTGIFFGSYPAYRAAKLTPIDALRS